MGVIVTGALCWWNELPEDLDRCVRAAANLVDRIVAIDGSYRRYPGATITSPPEQAEAIRSAAKDVGIGCLMLAPDRLWAGQVEKRNYLLNMAAIRSDWICTLDADHIVVTDRAAARAELEASGADSMDVAFHTPLDPSRSLDESAVGLWHEAQSRSVIMTGEIWRAYPGLLVERFHWWYSAIKPDGKRYQLWGGNGSYPPGTFAEFSTPFRVDHRTLFRTKEQILASRAFCNDRVMVVERTGQEDDVPGLPEPVWDYKNKLV